ncbi:MAG TPA: aminotransferase class V-fold PLP-dependent enzyme [Albitalea sp.]|uniref:aminotransferase class V-fold PLP-dependent enzyme n=1 Tax=Piscinibacter sp. TaxID=1903157 RepID=UPI002ED096EE
MTTTNPTPFGRGMLAHWLLDPDAAYLNHGTFGVTPTRVLDLQHALHAQIERHPARFMARELMSLDPQPPAQRPRLRAAAEDVAAFLGARGDDLVFVDNATSGVNAVLRSLRLAAGDEIVLLDHAYGAVARAAAFVAREHRARVVTVALPFPLEDDASCLEPLAAALTPRTRIAILDHITSETALVLPLARMAALCHARGVPVLGDGAHAPGAIDVDIPSLGVDWYAANLHKWAFAPRGCGVLWASADRREGLHPPIISWGLDVGWHQEFDWTGTRDPTPFLCAPAGIAFITDFLGTDAMRAYNHALAWQAAGTLTTRWGLPWTTPKRMVGCMATVPLPAACGATAQDASRLREWLLCERRIEVAVVSRAGRLWARVSAQVYNDMGDIDRLADAVDAAIGLP